MISACHVADRQEARDKLKADMERYTGTITQVPAGVSGDTYCARMNQHAIAQKKECEAKRAAQARRRGARNKPQA